MEEGHSRERVRATRVARDIVKKAKKQKTAPTQAKPKVTGSSPSLVKTPMAQSEPFVSSIKGKGVLKKKKKPQREYVAISLVASKTESDVEIQNAPKKGEFARLIWKPQSNEGNKGWKQKKEKIDLVLASKPKRGGRTKLELDVVIESNKMETTKTKYYIIPPLSIQEN